MSEFKTDDMITHLEKGGVYQVMGTIKVKINGEWIEHIRYATTDGGEQEYARRPEDMIGKFAHCLE